MASVNLGCVKQVSNYRVYESDGKVPMGEFGVVVRLLSCCGDRQVNDGDACLAGVKSVSLYQFSKVLL